LKLHDKPILICDIAGSAGPLMAMVEAAITAGFARSDARQLFELVSGVSATMERLRHLATIHGGATALL
jgi:predicted Rossmann-fold nucleotide-binding protein